MLLVRQETSEGEIKFATILNPKEKFAYTKL